jgi:hypothetical protein
MRKTRFFFSFLIMSTILLAFSVQRENEQSVTSGIEWIKTEHDFGKIKQNIPVTATFEFRNTSMVPLVIISVEPQCGCTVADYPKEPVKYGKSGVVSVYFDARNAGYFQKSVIVATNAEQGSTTLIIKGDVVTPDD